MPAPNEMWLEVRVVPDLTTGISNLAGAGPGRIWELKSGRSWIWGEFVFGSQMATMYCVFIAADSIDDAISFIRQTSSSKIRLLIQPNLSS